MGREASDSLPDLFRFSSGQPVRGRSDWELRRRELRDLIVNLEYGGLPPVPAWTRWEELHSAACQSVPGARFVSCRVMTGPQRPFSFLLYLLIPPGKGPFPVVLNGDGCWRCVTEEVAAEVLGRGCILAQFNRVEIVPDTPHGDRTSGLYRVYPEGTYGALAAWAWGYHRCVDALSAMDCVDTGRIAVGGHSRGGKTTLLAGATDERIALTSANNSGAGGAGCYRCQGPDSERLEDSLRVFPYWYGPQLKEFVHREKELPFDQHFLKALVAPRALLTTEALGDHWANPTGTWQTHQAACEVYRFLQAEQRIGIYYRPGGHAHGLEDWRILMDFLDWQFAGRPRRHDFAANPFPELPRAFSWRAPTGS